MRKRYLAGIAIGAVCLFLAFRKVEWRLMAEAFRAADYRLLPLFIACHLLGVVIRVWRWGAILAPVKRAGFRNLLSSLSIGFMVNFLFPARAGELVRAFILGRRETISKSACFATIILERLFDGFAILVFLGLFPLFLSVPPGMEGVIKGIRMGGLAALLVYVAILALLIFFSLRRELFLSFTGWCCRFLPEKAAGPLQRGVASFGEGLILLGSPGHIAAVTGWSLLLWTLLGVANWFMMLAFGLKLPLFAGLFLVVVQSFGVMVPSPGFVGAFQYAHVLGLSLFGVGKELALSLAILLHACLFAIYLGLGAVFLWLEGMGLGEVRHRGEGAAPDEAKEQ